MKQRNPDIDFGFHATVPRMVRTEHPKLTPIQKWLYVCLKDLCGDHGTCFRALRVLAEETGISTGMLSESIPALHAAGLIHAEKKKRHTGGKEVWHITIVDIWAANAKLHPTKRSQREQTSEENVHNVDNNVHNVNKPAEECSQNEQERSHCETEAITRSNNSIEAITDEEESIATSAEDRNAPAPENVISYENGLKRKTDPNLKAVKPYDILASNPIIHTRNPYHDLDPYPFGYRSDLPDIDPINQDAWQKALQAKEQAVNLSDSQQATANDDFDTDAYEREVIGAFTGAGDDDTPTQKREAVRLLQSEMGASVDKTSTVEHVPQAGNMATTRPAWVTPAPTSKTVAQATMPEPKELSAKQRAQAEKSGLERRQDEIWAIIERKFEVKYRKSQRTSMNNAQGMGHILEDGYTDQELEDALSELDNFDIKKFHLKSFHERIPGLLSVHKRKQSGTSPQGKQEPPVIVRPASSVRSFNGIAAKRAASNS